MMCILIDTIKSIRVVNDTVNDEIETQRDVDAKTTLILVNIDRDVARMPRGGEGMTSLGRCLNQNSFEESGKQK